MATLTYDPTEPQEGEFSKEEQEAIEVGEKLAEAEQTLLAGKFKDAEELEKGYIELQKKLGQPKEEAQPEEEEAQPEAKEETEEKVETEEITNVLDTLWEQANNKDVKPQTIEKLKSMSQEDLAKLHLEYRQNNPGNQDLSQQDVTRLQSTVGGEQAYKDMIKWAGSNLKPEEAKMYDSVMQKGDPQACYFAVRALSYRYNDAQGIDGKVITGKAPTSKGNAFRSQAEVVRAMSDPKYDNDPAYRQDIYDKLERSNISF